MSLRVVIAGGHGNIALHLTKELSGRGDTVIGLIRNPSHVHDVHTAGGEALLLNLEHAPQADVVEALEGADAVVFAAGAGPGSGAARKDTVDRGAAVLLADAAEKAGVRRFIQISAFGAGAPVPDGADEVWAAYLTAKTEAEQDLMQRATLDWTILRPGLLTNDEPSGLVSLSSESIPKDSVSRADVAAVLAALLHTDHTVNQILHLTQGTTEIPEAVANSA
ncbi:SDR family oxidoreductase [Hoyosella rhizosphaerae]|uniref:NAD(P)-binding domain-containing protein n=1 Tax=Hoyosella rhizosphaerae TaxID=1755582 RepID=A0A916U8C3_9ACTN|nr:NAD(P)-binding oxidoreductase [Hoyosella rhizosphaerae]MBN4927561.1 SDR family oxidoreductase [Hoyosella rhizosphaerae]GGC63491.1 hypothetical protein GCM10011410_14940 [Hoyosella rhizosphaerae]